MTLSLYGINHNTAPVAIRERLAIMHHDVPHALKSFLQKGATIANEAVILSTCNRTELYSDLPDTPQNHQALLNWLSEFRQIETQTLHTHLYVYQNQAVAQHLMRVASGLNSIPIGEPEILGQVKEAYSLAQSQGFVGHTLSKLFETSFCTAKQVRTETEIGMHSLSLAHATIDLAKRIFSNITQKAVLFIGAGEVIQSTATYLQKQHLHKFLLANRSVAKAAPLIEQLKASYIPMKDISDYLFQADIVISATASPSPLLTQKMIERTLKIRKHRPLLLIDLAVPRDIDPTAAELHDVFLYNIDDLQDILSKNYQKRVSSVHKAEAIIEAKSQHLMKEFKIRQAGHFIKAYQQQAAQLRDTEIKKARLALARGEEPETIIEQLVHRMINTLSHQPMMQLRQAALQDDPSCLTLLNQLLQIPNLQ